MARILNGVEIWRGFGMRYKVLRSKLMRWPGIWGDGKRSYRDYRERLRGFECSNVL